MAALPQAPFSLGTLSAFCRSGCFHTFCPTGDGFCSAGFRDHQAAEQTFSPQETLEASHQPFCFLASPFPLPAPLTLSKHPPTLEHTHSLACWAAVGDPLPFAVFFQP